MVRADSERAEFLFLGINEGGLTLGLNRVMMPFRIVQGEFIAPEGRIDALCLEMFQNMAFRFAAMAERLDNAARIGVIVQQSGAFESFDERIHHGFAGGGVLILVKVAGPSDLPHHDAPESGAAGGESLEVV